jgi:spore coat protein JB
MKLVYELGFAMTETVLYLDTHPDDAEALAYYAEMKEKYHDAVMYYSRNFGPLSSLHVTAENYWSWVMTPMPWELEGC